MRAGALCVCRWDWPGFSRGAPDAKRSQSRPRSPTMRLALPAAGRRCAGRVQPGFTGLSCGEAFVHHSRASLNRLALSAEDQTPILPGRRQSVFTDIGKQHVFAVPGRSRPQGDGAAFAGASRRHIFGACAGFAAPGIKSGMIDCPAHRHAFGMTMRHGLQCAAPLQRRQPVRLAE